MARRTPRARTSAAPPPCPPPAAAALLCHRPLALPHHPHPRRCRNAHQRGASRYCSLLQVLPDARPVREGTPLSPPVAAPRQRRPLCLRLERRRHHPCGQPALLWFLPTDLYVPALPDVELLWPLQRPPRLRLAPKRPIHHRHPPCRPPLSLHRGPSAGQPPHPRPQRLLPPSPPPRPPGHLRSFLAWPFILDGLHPFPYGWFHPLHLPQPPHL